MKYARALVKKVTEDGRLSAAVGSTDSVDRYGESIDQDSWDFTHFRNNPVLLWAHNLTMGEERPPIGRLENFRVEVVDSVKGIKGMVFDAVFDMKDAFAADIFRKYAEGFLNAFSVGFIAHSMEFVNDIPTLKNNELLEMSAVPVPANPEALAQLRARSFSARSWDSMLKEAEAEAEKNTDEASKTDDVEPAKPADNEPAAPVVPETEPLQPAETPDNVDPNNPAIVDDAGTQPAVNEGEADKTAPKKHSQKGEKQLDKGAIALAIVREATGQLQEALRLINESARR